MLLINVIMAFYIHKLIVLTNFTKIKRSQKKAVYSKSGDVIL